MAGQRVEARYNLVQETYLQQDSMFEHFSSSNRFVSAHPRNDPMLGGTFLTVERRMEAYGSNGTGYNHQWEVLYTDADWETM